MNVKRLLIALSAVAFAFTVSASTGSADAKTMKKMGHSKMMKKGMMMKKKKMM